jgi:hypothetical protein
LIHFSQRYLPQAALVEFLQLAIIERDQRFLALQGRWDGLGQAKGAIANGDYEAAMRIGVVCRRVRWIAASARGQRISNPRDS